MTAAKALGPTSEKIQDNIRPLSLSRQQQDSAEGEARAVYQQECEDSHKLRHNSLLVTALESETSKGLITFFNGPGALSQARAFPVTLSISMDWKLLIP